MLVSRIDKHLLIWKKYESEIFIESFNIAGRVSDYYTAILQLCAKRMDHGSFSGSCGLNIVVCSITLPLVWINLGESWGLEEVFVLKAIFSI